ncbi:hypothetical protein ACH5RR_003793 [Cinchona calisaya]|uniref:Uncharacterized protein n=1 Tax=Cinchona calisaya TaxID=153742 RepID=A0ABD3AWI8_9GENT
MDVNSRIHTSSEKLLPIAQSPYATSTPAMRSPWHSPVPYLFGGLAAMLGLIAFALLILACSYWRLSGYVEGGNSNNERDLEAGGESNQDGSDGDLKKPAAPPVFEEKFLVIMPGQHNPTCLATPMSSRASSFGSTATSNSSCSSENSEKSEGESEIKKLANGLISHVEMANLDAHHDSTNQGHQV